MVQRTQEKTGVMPLRVVYIRRNPEGARILCRELSKTDWEEIGPGSERKRTSPIKKRNRIAESKARHLREGKESYRGNLEGGDLHAKHGDKKKKDPL